MNWQSHMRVGISQAEDRIHARLQQLGLTKGMFRNRKVKLPLDTNDRHRYTEPDFCWPMRTPRVAMYLDGPPHLKSHSITRDERITTQLREAGWRVLRFAYKPPLSQKRLREICVLIRQFLEANQC